MSLDLNWERLTGGADGEALAESIRAFIDDRFQKVTLPKMIRSVQVHSFDFGTVAPELELKDVSDPLPDFYDEDDEDEGESTAHQGPQHNSKEPAEDGAEAEVARPEEENAERSLSPLVKPTDPVLPRRPSVETNLPMLGNTPSLTADSAWPMFSRSSTPGIPGGTANLSYFHLPLSAGIAGGATPFGALASPHGWLDHQYGSLHHHGMDNPLLGRRLSLASAAESAVPHVNEKLDAIPEETKENTTEDVQIVAHVRYAGDVKLCLTADILLDYPMPSFVGIPLQLRVTGMTFDGIAVAAYIKNKAHFCFLSPEDAQALVGADAFSSDEEGGAGGEDEPSRPVGALFEDIKVESEIGRRASGKQVLKNVSKVEKFVLEQVRKIFETEFVFPSFWTFLV